LQATLDGRRPGSHQSLLWFRRADRLPGFDLTFSAPKGISLLFALSDPRTSLLVREAHDRAVAAALGYLEREAGEVRRGRDGVDRLPGGGFVAASGAPFDPKCSVAPSAGEREAGLPDIRSTTRVTQPRR
jgi:conjugative relaxase-like TrwC/TraI family protein